MWSGHFNPLGVFFPRPSTPNWAVKGRAAELEGLLAILPERREASYEPTKEELKSEGEAGGVEAAEEGWA